MNPVLNTLHSLPLRIGDLFKQEKNSYRSIIQCSLSFRASLLQTWHISAMSTVLHRSRSLRLEIKDISTVKFKSRLNFKPTLLCQQPVSNLRLIKSTIQLKPHRLCNSWTAIFQVFTGKGIGNKKLSKARLRDQRFRSVSSSSKFMFGFGVLYTELTSRGMWGMWTFNHNEN